MIREMVAPFTMVSPERIDNMVDSVRTVVGAGVPGAIVETGVWRGGCMMAAAYTLLGLGQQRDLYLFDTFAGMTEPDPFDVDFEGNSATAMMVEHPLVAAVCSLNQVKQNMKRTNYPSSRIHYIKGPIEQTLHHHTPDQIALLRIDVDWYRSTKTALAHLWPRLSPGGRLIIDDYGWWQGCRLAVDEYFGDVEWNHIDDIGVWIEKI